MATHSHAGTPHTHDGIDWMARLSGLRKADEVDAPASREVAERLVERTPRGSTVLDVGSGAGGMSVALIEAMSRHGGGRIVLVDATPELLESADELARATAAAHGDVVTVETKLVDLADRDSLARVPKAQLLWAANVVHHLPDQQQTLADLAGLLVSGGCLALSEGGLPLRCLPWDIGVGEPGLHERLSAVQGNWFRGMRADMPDAVPMPYGWNRALANIGLVSVTAFSYLIDRPSPTTEPVRESVLKWLEWMGQIGEGQLTDSDIETVRRLLDESDSAYVGNRDDVFMLTARTVHLGWAP
jgi:SAM-dependent methyltransferase